LSDKEWGQIINDMIWSFEFYGSDQKYECMDQEKWDRAQKGLDLFARYYGDLWH